MNHQQIKDSHTYNQAIWNRKSAPRAPRNITRLWEPRTHSRFTSTKLFQRGRRCGANANSSDDHWQDKHASILDELADSPVYAFRSSVRPFVDPSRWICAQLRESRGSDRCLSMANHAKPSGSLFLNATRDFDAVFLRECSFAYREAEDWVAFYTGTMFSRRVFLNIETKRSERETLLRR